jgi:transposase InsO family protein
MNRKTHGITRKKAMASLGFVTVHTHILTIIDRTTRWLEAIPLQSTSARACTDALVEGWIARFGVPAHISTDRGVQFTSEVWSLLCDTLGVSHSMTTSYHPQSNGMIERSHRQIKDSLRSRVAGRYMGNKKYISENPVHFPFFTN